jgi:hypothetical protein
MTGTAMLKIKWHVKIQFSKCFIYSWNAYISLKSIFLFILSSFEAISTDAL